MLVFPGVITNASSLSRRMVCVHLLRGAEAGWRMLFKAASVLEEP